MTDAFKDYFHNDGHLQAHPMIREMYETNRKIGLPSEEAAKMELATSLAMLSSGAITTFWLLFQIYSDVDTLRAICLELSAISEEQESCNASKSRKLRLNDIEARCPILAAMFYETLRYHSNVISIKQVQHDTILDDQYLLKENGIVMIPGHSVHHNQHIWGHNADVFDHTRFLCSEGMKMRLDTGIYRPFGAGATRCPGRMFSTNIIMGLASMMVLQYDVLPLTGEWIAPTKLKADLWNAMPKPDQDIDVDIMARRNDEIDWNFECVSKPMD
jgi:cytochrome P450